MFYIDSNDDHIYISRGDSATLDITMMKDDTEYTLQPGDKLYFALKRNNDFNFTIWSSEVTEQSIVFDVATTNSWSFGDYDYSITLIYANGNKDTFITGKLTVLGVSYGD